MPFYKDRRGSGPAVVLLHGWGLHGGVWSDVAAALVGEFCVTAVDLPGFGRSRDCWRAGADREALADQLLEELPDPAVWIGWSLGALLALTAAQRAPQRVARLVLIGATPRFAQAADWLCAMPLATLRQFGADLADDHEKTVLRFLSLNLGDGESDRQLLRRLRALLTAHGEPDPGALRQGLRLLEQADLRAALPNIETPTLVLHGRRDRLAPIAAAEYLVERLPNARAAVIDAAGHAPFLSHPAETLVAVRDFLA
jgi:pimeloyl-[acyl-carrier protein] methyl ester esterase